MPNPLKVFIYQNDHLGTPQKITAGNGTVVWSAKYNSFGEATIDIETVENNLRFAGQYEDAETGLHYNCFRYYDAELGRYLRTDPIGLIGGNNFYIYVENTPLKYIDPIALITFSPAVDQIIRDTISDIKKTSKKYCKSLPPKSLSDWEISWKEPIEYEVLIVFTDIFGAVGAAHWKKTQKIWENKLMQKRQICFSICGVSIEDGETYYEDRNKSTTLARDRTTAYRFSTGNNLSQGEKYWTFNPWTGKKVIGNIPPGS